MAGRRRDVIRLSSPLPPGTAVRREVGLTGRAGPRGAGRLGSQVDESVCIAAGQQEILFALFVGWECLQTRKRTAEGAKGRPPLAPVLGACGGTVASAALIMSATDLGTRAGLVGTLVCVGGLGALYVKRFTDTENDPLEWPGPKAWPGFGIFASWMAFLASTQALSAINNPLLP